MINRPKSFYCVAAGYTLIELMVTLSIIIIISSLLFVSGKSMINLMHKKTTETIVQSLKSVAQEYEIETGTKIGHWDSSPSTAYLNVDWTVAQTKNASGATGTGMVDNSIERFVWAAYKNEVTRKMLQAIGKQFVLDSDSDGFIDVVDAWGVKIYYAADSTANAADNFLPPQKRPFFASGGQDNDIGDASTVIPPLPPFTLSPLKDNIYSFTIE